MAQRMNIVIVDDIDGKELPQSEAQTVRFSLDGAQYEIDLSDKNAEALRKAFAKYTSAGRKVGKAAKVTNIRSASRNSDGLDKQKVREWAKANGHTVSDRGRVPQPIIDAYLAAV